MLKSQNSLQISKKQSEPVFKSNASADELTKLVLEAVILLENSGLLVDAVVTDGASWNRSMWIQFGVTKENPSAEHPCDPLLF